MSLMSLLDDGGRFDAEYRGGLSNHLPMALVALSRLGAGEGALEAFAEDYRHKLDAAPAEQPWPAGDAWRGRFGDRAAWPAYRSLFNEWMVFEDVPQVLEQVLPALMPGCGAAAFHGLIRTAYALEAGHERELADGVAYWSCRFLPLGPLPADQGDQGDPEVLLRALRPTRSRAKLIFERMHDASRDAGLHRQVARLRLDEGTLQRLSRLAAKAYAGSGNFTALHLVTGCHAMRVLSPYLPEPLLALRWFWQAYAAAVAAAGMTLLGPCRPRSWSELVAAALASHDDHLIKLIHSCREEEAAYGGDDWRLAASRALEA